MYLSAFVLFVLGTYVAAQAQDFGYPGDDHDVDKAMKNAQDRKPLYIPGRCNNDEYLYPGDHENEWVCDCKPGYVYHPDTSACYYVYRQGPCKTNEILILPQGKVIPECVPNPCGEDGKVKFFNACYELHKPGPCILPQLSNVVSVNVTTLEIQCQKMSVDLFNRFSEDEVQQYEVQGEVPACAKGSKRQINGKCE